MGQAQSARVYVRAPPAWRCTLHWPWRRRNTLQPVTLSTQHPSGCEGQSIAAASDMPAADQLLKGAEPAVHAVESMFGSHLLSVLACRREV